MSWKSSGLDSVIRPLWSAPANVKALFTTRIGGCSAGSYQSLNVATHVDDLAEAVQQNRELLKKKLPGEPFWLDQVHSNRCINLNEKQSGCFPQSNRADASLTGDSNQVLAVMVADCLPILLCTRKGDRVGVIHAGWRGLASGIIDQTIGIIKDDWIAWMGPAIGPCHYEVGGEVRDRFEDKTAFVSSGSRWMMDLYAIARRQLEQSGVTEVFGGELCTYCDSAHFYSYRRDGVTGRMAGLIWRS